MITPEQFLGNLKTAPLRHGERYDNEILAEWNRNQPCAICGAKPPSDNSHTLKKKRSGNNGSQVYAIPLCREHHREYESLGIEDYLQAYPNLFEIVTRNIERAFDHFIELQSEPKKSKPRQVKKTDSIFKKVKGNRKGLEKCTGCFYKSYPTDEIRHQTGCDLAG